jgi:hypothetical protein
MVIHILVVSHEAALVFQARAVLKQFVANTLMDWQYVHAPKEVLAIHMDSMVVMHVNVK